MEFTFGGALTLYVCDGERGISDGTVQGLPSFDVVAVRHIKETPYTTVALSKFPVDIRLIHSGYLVSLCTPERFKLDYISTAIEDTGFQYVLTFSEVDS